MRSKVILLLSVLIAGLAGPAFAAGAGSQVQIVPSLRFAGGTLSTVRASSSTSEYISCEVYSPGTRVNCSARDAAGITARCTSTLAHDVDQVLAIKETSHVSFYWTDGGVCNGINVNNSSYYLR